MSLVGYKQNAIWFVSNPDWILYGNIISIEGITVAHHALCEKLPLGRVLSDAMRGRFVSSQRSRPLVEEHEMSFYY